MKRLDAWRDAIRAVQAAYVWAHGRPGKLFRPRRFTDKMQWRKLFDFNPSFGVFCDKLATRDWVAARIGSDYLPRLYWAGDIGEIPLDGAIPAYVLKSTHASGDVLFVTTEKLREPDAITALAAAWLGRSYYDLSGEPGYKNVPRRLMAEEILLSQDGGTPDEHRLFVFDGKVGVINTVFVEDRVVRNGAFHTPDWTKLPWYFTRLVTREFPRPKCLDEMIRIAERLGKGIDHIRVDFYDCGDRIFVGELTAYSWSGHSRFNPDEADLALGRYWRLGRPMTRALAAILFRSR